MQQPSLADATLSWRAIVLYGINTATYKIALGRALEQLAHADRDRVTMPELAEVFFDLYAERLMVADPSSPIPAA